MKTIPEDPDDHFDSISKVLLTDSRVTKSKMFGSVCLKLKGKVFAMLFKGGLVAKLPHERVKQLVELGKGKYFDPGHGRLMKEWIRIENDKDEWLRLAEEARNFRQENSS